MHKHPEALSDPDIYSDIPFGEEKKAIEAAEGKPHSPYAGFAAGILSGWTKLVVGQPPDTIKTRLQCTPPGFYKGAWDCFTKTVSKEGPRALYKGASIPAMTWPITDALLMGSIHNYRAFLLGHGFQERIPGSDKERLSILGHTVAGLFAGWTNSIVCHPSEIVKCKLQLQLARPAHIPKLYSGPLDVIKQTVQQQGVFFGMWRGWGASLIFRSYHAAMFGSFEILNRMFKSWDGTSWEIPTELANFLAGGLASNVYWIAALPTDNVKNRIMADDIKNPKYKGVFDAYKKVWMETYDPSKGFGWNAAARWKTLFRGFVPVVVRAFPTNAAALMVWEGVMRYSGAK
ncbi:hypothetical protein IAR50_002629 [Cryptococcus sp. DSM 104548]